MISKFGGIYKDKKVPLNKAEFMIAWGKDCVCVIYDGIDDIASEVEHGGLHNMELVEGYGLTINKEKNEWYIRNSSRKNQDDYIIAQGKYEPGFYESLKPYLAILNK